MNTTLGKLGTLFKPDPEYHYNTEGYEIDRRQLSLWVGLTAILIPVVACAFVFFGNTHFRDSISAFYYSPVLGDLFIVALSFIGAFLLIYRGESGRETFWATMAGFCAYCVALFPTTGSGIEPGSEAKGRIFADMATVPSKGPITFNGDISVEYAFKLFDWSEYVHYTAAAGLFVFLAYYCFFVFTRIKDIQLDKTGNLTAVKKRRNDLYRGTGVIIIICMIAMASQSFWGSYWEEINGTFIFESLALIAFGFAWIVKGKFWGYLADEN